MCQYKFSHKSYFCFEIFQEENLYYQDQNHHMRKQLSSKNAEFRKNIRRKQLEDYFKQRREQECNNQNKEAEEKFNKTILQHISKENIREIYELIYKAEVVKKINMLTKATCIYLYKFLVLNINQIECVLLLKSLIDVDYRVIFLNKEQYQTNCQFINILYAKIDEKVRQFGDIQDEKSRRQFMNIISGYLDCLRSLIFNKDEKQEQFMFNAAFQPNIIQRLWFHVKIFIRNPIYLMILALSEMDFNISAMPQIQQLLYSNVDIIKQLISQIDAQTTQKKSVALPSLALINSILKNMQDRKEFIIQILPPYLEKTKLVLSNSQENSNKNFAMVHFYDMLDNVIQFFDLLSQQLLTVHLGEMMKRANLWTFFYLLLRIQIHEVRLQIYQIIKFAVKNMLICKALTKDYVTQELVSFIVEGMESKYQEIVRPCLEALQYLVYSAGNLQREFVVWLEQYEASNCLENLEYSPNEDISKIASALIKYIKNIDSNGNQMSLE